MLVQSSRKAQAGPEGCYLYIKERRPRQNAEPRLARNYSQNADIYIYIYIYI